jgi:hypothetical protein
MNDHHHASKSKKTGGGQPGNKNAEKWTEEKAIGLAERLIEWLSPKFEDKNGNIVGYDVHEKNIFFRYFLIFEAHCGNTIIAEMSKKFESFSKLIEIAKEMQQQKLWAQGVEKKISPQITKFALSAIHGFAERQDVDIDVNTSNYDFSKLTDDELATVEAILEKAGD